MPQPGSNSRGLRTIIVALAIGAVVAIGAWTLAGHFTRRSSPATATITTSGSVVPDERPVAADHTAVASKKIGIKHSVVTAPSPPTHAPLAQIYDNLKRRADSGDAEAATRVFHEVHRCIEVRWTRRLLAELPSDLVTLEQRDDREIGVMRAGQALQIKRVREMTDYIQANAARCDGATDAQLASFTPLLLQAAQLGDLKALDCYVGSDFDRMEGLLDHPEWIDQYRAQVPGLVESALQRGDWVVVDLLHHAYSGAFDTSARGQLFGIDPLMDYRLLRLEQLGATGGFADKLAPMVAGAANTLSAAQAAAAEAWANDYYSRYFNSVSDEVSNGADICEITDD
jgi:hypothetical protein